MKAKDYLLQLAKLDEMIENKLSEKAYWEDVAMRCGCSLSTEERVQSSGSKQKMEEAICNAIDIEIEEIERLKATRNEIISTLEQLNADGYRLLYRLYVKRMDYNAAADSMGKSYSWATTMHGRALQRVQKILDSRVCDNV